MSLDSSFGSSGFGSSLGSSIGGQTCTRVVAIELAINHYFSTSFGYIDRLVNKIHKVQIEHGGLIENGEPKFPERLFFPDRLDYGGEFVVHHMTDINPTIAHTLKSTL